MRDTDPDYRVLNLATSTFNDSRTSYFHKSVGGYSPAKLRRYQDIIDTYLGNSINMNVLNMLNVRYVIIPSEEAAPQVQMNPEAFGNCWFVDSIVWTDTPDDEIRLIGDGDLRSCAYIEKSWQEQLADSKAYCNLVDSTSYIYLDEYKNPGYLVYKSSSSAPHLAVFSEVYYKTWKAYIDGKEVPLLRANYLLRALPVPAGEHHIELRCVDEVILASAKISLVSSVLVGLLMLLLLGVIIYKKVKE